MIALTKNHCIRIAGLLMMALLWSVPVGAQTTDPMTSGILAFRGGEYDKAVGYFNEALKADPRNSEAHFLLARLYWETDLRNVREAGRQLEAALEIEPENVQYMVALLQQLRADSPLFVVDQSREARRRRLALQILKLDETNSFAHEPNMTRWRAISWTRPTSWPRSTERRMNSNSQI
jgi:tetratricopeptide (TPR) repeat protein